MPGRSKHFSKLRRLREAAFWLFSPDNLVVAVCRKTKDEPVLVRCAAVSGESKPDPSFYSPGLLEAARAAEALELPHIVAIEHPECRLVGSEELTHTPERVNGSGEHAVDTDLQLINSLVDLFDDAGLVLRHVDHSTCSELSLGEFLGESPQEEQMNYRFSGDPLAAVSIVSNCEPSAAALGSLLAAPIGLALVCFGFVTDAFD